MTMIVQMTDDERRNLTKPEKAIVTALPTMLEGQFYKLMRVMIDTGILTKEGGPKQLNMAVIVDAYYSSLIGVFTLKGSVTADEAQIRVNKILEHVMKNTSFKVGDMPSEGCGEADCPACGSASDEPEESKAAPVGVTKH